MDRLNNKTEHELLLLYRNITKTLEQLKNDKESSEPYYNDNSNAWYAHLKFLNILKLRFPSILIRILTPSSVLGGWT